MIIRPPRWTRLTKADAMIIGRNWAKLTHARPMTWQPSPDPSQAYVTDTLGNVFVVDLDDLSVVQYRTAEQERSVPTVTDSLDSVVIPEHLSIREMREWVQTATVEQIEAMLALEKVSYKPRKTAIEILTEALD